MVRPCHRMHACVCTYENRYNYISWALKNGCIALKVIELMLLTT